MGSHITAVKTNSFRKNTSPLLSVSLSKLRDYHASFKSICDNFSMDLSEFEHIFGASESAFVIWDTDNNGLIDSLELFSGICIFSETKFDDKLRFLFDLFDFNELESLSPVDIEFMIYSCMSATFKIYSISTELNNDELSNFSLKYFGTDNRLTVVELIKNAKSSGEITDYFGIISKDQNHQLNESKSEDKVDEKQSSSKQFVN